MAAFEKAYVLDNTGPVIATRDRPAVSSQEPAIRFPLTIALILVLSAVGLTYEIAAGRVLAPFFGTSLLTWTTVIATVLGGFSLGSALGAALIALWLTSPLAAI